MDVPDIEKQKSTQLTILVAQRTALLSALDLHVRRSEELALQVQQIDQEIEAVVAEGST
jgi:hypothetical protein